MKKTPLVLLLALLLVISSCSKIKTQEPNKLSLSKVFSENMVLQQGEKVKIWGHSAPKSMVTVEILGESLSTKANSKGKWELSLGPLKAGGPYEMKVSSNEELITLKEVYVGEVWLALGQSNMELQVEKSLAANEVINEANQYQDIKFFNIKENPSREATRDIETTQWQSINSKTIRKSSALAYNFAKQIHDKYKVPVGIVQATWAATSIEAWMSKEALKSVKGFKGSLNTNKFPEQYWFYSNFALDPDLVATKNAYVEMKFTDYPLNYSIWVNGLQVPIKPGSLSHRIPIDALKADNLIRIKLSSNENTSKEIERFRSNVHLSLIYIKDKFYRIEKWVEHPILDPKSPTVLFNALINPLTQYKVKGVIWYQGENNIDDPNLYKELFSEMVKDLRTRWGDDLDWYSVQLAAYDSKDRSEKLAEFRQVQEELSEIVPNHRMAISIDLYDDDFNIHPKNKKEIARRLFMLADKFSYMNNELNPLGPRYRSFEIEGNKVKLEFENTGGSLITLSENITGFELAGEDEKFYVAKAKLSGETVVVSASPVEKPKFIRYLYSDMPRADLFSRDGMPVAPFKGKL